MEIRYIGIELKTFQLLQSTHCIIITSTDWSTTEWRGNNLLAAILWTHHHHTHTGLPTIEMSWVYKCIKKHIFHPLLKIKTPKICMGTKSTQSMDGRMDSHIPSHPWVTMMADEYFCSLSRLSIPGGVCLPILPPPEKNNEAKNEKK